MELVCANRVHVSSSSSSLSPAIGYSRSRLNSGKLNWNSPSKCRSRRPAAVRAQKSDSVAQLDKLPSTSSALEQLDFERGVCVPFRKYTPESVRIYIYFLTYYCRFSLSQLWIYVCLSYVLGDERDRACVICRYKVSIFVIGVA